MTAVLILTHSQDGFVVELVERALEERGARALRVDTDRYPRDVRLTTAIDGAAHRTSAGFALDDVAAVWARKIWPPRLPDELDPAIADGCRREAAATLSGWLEGLADRRWVDPLDAVGRAENKVLQLRRAAEVGLDVPRTLVTNDAREVLAFRDEVGAIVTKMQTPLSTSMDGSGPFVHTRAVEQEDLAALDGLALCPMVFQERLDKLVELRVVCVGEQLFVGALDPHGETAGAAPVDWREARPADVPWAPGELPAAAGRALRDLLASFGLRYAAADVVLTPGGRCVFLEINPRGEWGMLERDLGLPIADAIASELLHETSP